jgi:hypothetical protein
MIGSKKGCSFGLAHKRGVKNILSSLGYPISTNDLRILKF